MDMAIVIRIKTPTGDMDSSVDCPSLLNFNDLLVSLQNATELARLTLTFDFTLRRRFSGENSSTMKRHHFAVYVNSV